MEIFFKILFILGILCIEIGIGVFLFNVIQWLIIPYFIFCAMIDIPLAESLDERN